MKGIKSLINQSLQELRAQAAHAKTIDDTSSKVDAEIRMRYLIRLSEEFEEAQIPEKTVFISFSKTTGNDYYVKAREIAESMGFFVITGFDSTRETTTLRAVRNSIGSSATFLSIMTPEYSITDINSNSDIRKAPSVWVIEEKGMALAMAKPFQLLVDASVHRDFWYKTTPEQLHKIYSGANFVSKAEEALLALERRYIELLKISVNV